MPRCASHVRRRSQLEIQTLKSRSAPNRQKLQTTMQSLGRGLIVDAFGRLRALLILDACASSIEKKSEAFSIATRAFPETMGATLRSLANDVPS